MRGLLLTLVALAMVGGPAQAGPDPLRAAVFRAPPPGAALPDRSEPPRDFGMPTNALERHFGHSEVTGSAGFLCGIQPKAMTEGAAAAYGVDPHGRFLGLKLRVPLR